MTKRRRPRTRPHSGSRPDTAGPSGCRLSLWTCWELFQRRRTAAQPSSSSSSYTGPWRDTGRTGTRTVNKQAHRNNGILIRVEDVELKTQVHLGKEGAWNEAHTMLTIWEQGSPFFFGAWQVPKSWASPISSTFCWWSTVRLTWTSSPQTLTFGVRKRIYHVNSFFKVLWNWLFLSSLRQMINYLS